MTDIAALIPYLKRIAEAAEQLTTHWPAPAILPDEGEAFIWRAGADGGSARVPLLPGVLEAVEQINRLPLNLLLGIEPAKQRLYDNTYRFAKGFPANNALLWGARGTGKSSLVKAVHGAVNAALASSEPSIPLALIEIHREDLHSLPDLLHAIRRSQRRCLVFCDDLSFDTADTSYKSLKAVLEGGIEGRPNNALFYASSNRRHLMPREMIDNERSTAINPSEAVEEKVSLSDRFGLWIGFHNMDQETYLAIVEGYARYFKLDMPQAQLVAEATEWSAGRGARSGRVGWQFIQEVAGRLGQSLDPGSHFDSADIVKD